MNGLKSSFIQLPPRLSVPTLPPSTPLQCRTPSPSPTPQHTHTLAHINTHTPCPAPWRTQAGGCEWVGFPNYLNRFQQMVEELSSWGHVALSSQILVCSATDLTASTFLSLPSPKTSLNCWNKQRDLPRQTVNSFSVTPKTRRCLALHLPFTSAVCPPQQSSTVGSDIQRLNPAGTVNHALRLSDAFPGTG